MAQIAARRDPVPDRLLQLAQLGKTPRRLSIEEKLISEPNPKDSGLAPGNEGDLPELLLESREKLLRDPARTQKPAAARAILDFDARSFGWIHGDLAAEYNA